MRANVSVRVLSPLLALALLTALVGGAIATRGHAVDARAGGPLAVAGILSPSPSADTRSPRPGQVVDSVPGQAGPSQRPPRSPRPLNSANAATSAGVVASDAALAASLGARASASARVVASDAALAASIGARASASALVVASDLAAASARARASASARAANRPPVVFTGDDAVERVPEDANFLVYRFYASDPDGDPLTYTFLRSSCATFLPSAESIGVDLEGQQSCIVTFSASDGINGPVEATVTFVKLN